MLMRCLVLLLTASQVLTAAGHADNGLVAIGRSSSTPVIDGNPTDSAWADCISISPFILIKQNQFALEQTQVRMCWDTSYLYVAFECLEWALEPLANRMHEFQANVKTHDSNEIFKDDCIVLLLQPDPAGPVYDFTVNANSMLADSIAPPNDLWLGRDLSYSSGAKVAAARFPDDRNGRWCVEMAIPFENMKIKPNSGDQWRFTVGRFEKSRGEISAFQRIPKGMHDTSSLGELKFIDKTPGIRLSSMPDFLPGNNQLSFDLHTEQYQMPLKMMAAVQFDKQKPVFFSSHFPIEARTGVCPFELSGSGMFHFYWQAENAATLQALIRSPNYDFRVSSNQLSNIATTGQVYVNGRQVEKGCLLISGINTIAIAAQKPFEARFQVGDFNYQIHSGWKYHPEEVKGWESGDFSDAAWEYASDAGVQAPGFYRMRLLLEQSKVWPNWCVNGVSINRGGLQQIIFAPAGIPGQTIQDCVIHFDLPEAFSSPGASGYYKTWPFEFKEEGIRVYHGKNFRRYSLVLQKPVPFNANLPLWQQIAFLIRAPEQYPSDTEVFYYSISSRSLALEEFPQPVTIRLLEPLHGKQPKKLNIQLWTGWLSSMDRPELHQYYGDEFVKMGVTNTGGLNNTHPGLTHFYLFGFAHWNFSCASYLEKYPEQEMLDRKGQKSMGGKDALVCSTSLVTDPRFVDYLRANLPEWYQRMKRPQNILWDYESRVMTSFLACFCPTCLKDFSNEFQIQETLTPDLIEQKYFQQWTVYMNRRVADFSGILKQVTKELFPESIFTFYSAYQSPESRHYYGIDWEMLAPHLDFASCGYGRTEVELQATRQALGKTPLMVGAIVYPYDVNSRSAPDFASCARLLRRACDGNAGFLVYSLESLDGRTFDAIAKVSRVMADHEEFFVLGQYASGQIQLSGFDRADYEVLQAADGRLLISLMNPSSGTRQFNCKVNLPPGCKLVNVLNGEQLPGNEAQGTIPANGMAVFVTMEGK